MSIKIPATCDHTAKPRRAAFTLLELIVAATLLSVVVLTFAPLMGWVSSQQHTVFERQMAMEEVENLAEQITVRPWDEVTPESLAMLTVSDACRRQLSDCRLEVALVEVADAPVSKRVTISLVWKDRAGRDVSPVRLTTWLYRTREAP
jgi:Tfp pilus assembly protein PilV